MPITVNQKSSQPNQQPRKTRNKKMMAIMSLQKSQKKKRSLKTPKNLPKASLFGKKGMSLEGGKLDTTSGQTKKRRRFG